MPFPVSREWISRTEEALGVRFPASLVARMLADNGGEIEVADDVWRLIPFRDESDRKRLARTANDIVYETRQARQWAGFPPGGVPIAAEGSGDLLILLPRDDDAAVLRDEILRWSHETGEVKIVALDFTQLGGPG